MYQFIKRNILLKTPRFVVNQDKVKDTFGVIKDFYYVEKPNAVSLVIYNDYGIGLISVLRYMADQETYEIPGGRIEENELPEISIKRELFEETGLNIREVNFLTKVKPLPSVTTEVVHIYYAKVDNNVNINKIQKSEGITRLEFIPFNGIKELIGNGAIECSVDGYALLYFLTYINDQ